MSPDGDKCNSSIYIYIYLNLFTHPDFEVLCAPELENTHCGSRNTHFRPLRSHWGSLRTHWGSKKVRKRQLGAHWGSEKAHWGSPVLENDPPELEKGSLGLEKAPMVSKKNSTFFARALRETLKSSTISAFFTSSGQERSERHKNT